MFFVTGHDSSDIKIFPLFTNDAFKCFAFWSYNPKNKNKCFSKLLRLTENFYTSLRRDKHVCTGISWNQFWQFQNRFDTHWYFSIFADNFSEDINFLYWITYINTWKILKICQPDFSLSNIFVHYVFLAIQKLFKCFKMFTHYWNGWNPDRKRHNNFNRFRSWKIKNFS